MTDNPTNLESTDIDSIETNDGPEIDVADTDRPRSSKDTPDAARRAPKRDSGEARPRRPLAPGQSEPDVTVVADTTGTDAAGATPTDTETTAAAAEELGSAGTAGADSDGMPSAELADDLAVADEPTGDGPADLGHSSDEGYDNEPPTSVATTPAAAGVERAEVVDIRSGQTAPNPGPSASPPSEVSTSRSHEAQRAVLEAVVVQADAPLMISQPRRSDEGGTGETQILFANDALLRLTGFARRELLGSQPNEIFDANDGGSVFASIERSLDAEFPVRQELLLRRKDGDSCWVDSHHFAVRGPGDDQLYYVALFRDLTPALEQEHWFRSLIESVSELVIVLDRRLIIRYISPAAEDLLGYLPEGLLGRDVRELLRVPDRERANATALKQVAQEGESFELSIPHAAGGSRVFEVSVSDRTADPAIAGLIVTARNITPQRTAEDQLDRTTRRTETLMAASGDAVFVLDDEGIIVEVGPTVERVLGHAADSLIGSLAIDLLEPYDRMRVRPTMDGLLSPGAEAEPLEVTLLHGRGGAVPFRISADVHLENPEINGIVVTLRDVSTERRYSDTLREQAEVLELIARGEPLETTLDRVRRSIEDQLPGCRVAIGVLDETDHMRHHAAAGLADDLVEALDRIEPTSPLAVALRVAEPGDLVADDVRTDERWADLAEVTAAGEWITAWSMPITARSTDALLGSITAFGRDDVDPTEADRDVLERAMHLSAVAIERHDLGVALAHHVLHDTVTGLPNRTLLIDRISQSLARSRRRRTQVAVVLVDLDRFKLINDSLGHAAGDHLLQLVARRFEALIRSGDTVGRIGGDEFVLVIDEVDGEDGAIDIAERVAEELKRPFQVAGTEVSITASMGIAIGTEDMDGEMLMRDADNAMYRAKDSGRAGHAVFKENFRQAVVERLEIEQALREAIEAKQFRLQYQPLIDLRDGALVGVEALVRWDRPEFGMVPPGDFIPVAEETGLIVPLGSWVLEEACRQAVAWPRLPSGFPVKMTVNMSARQLAAPGLIEVITDIIDRTYMDPMSLTFEVTESVLVEDVDRAVATLARLKELGVTVAIDDFGTGYASLDYVRRFHDADYLKIDRSFVAGLTDFDSQDSAIVSAAIVLAKAIGFEVVAEGVETREQLEVLRQLECELGQGWYFEKAIDPDEMEALIVEDRNWIE